VFTIPKALLCSSSAYFRAALNGPFIEGQTQTIDLDDEDPSIFRTYVAWLYQGQLNSLDIQEDLDGSQDFDLHIAKLIVFADKRHVGELKNDAISMFLSYLHKTETLATMEAICCVYSIPKSATICSLRDLLAVEEIWFGHRLTKKIDHWHPEFLARIIKNYKSQVTYRGRLLNGLFVEPDDLCDLCDLVHNHTVTTSCCSSVVKNVYIPAPPRAQQPPNKKRKIMQPIQTVELLDD